MERLSSVGVLANPASSKDIRRVVAQATLVPNHAKVNMLRRVLLGLAATPVQQVWYMPDDAGLMEAALDRLAVPFTFQALDMPITKSAADTTLAAQLFAEHEVGCYLTLGGDGTARAAVKGAPQLPLLALSTGTNNAFPQVVEPTLAGMAAGAVACGWTDQLTHAPLLELYCNGVYRDLALVDVAVVADRLGGRAVWEIERVAAVATTRLSPGTVGLSAIGGHLGEPAPTGTIAVGVQLAAHGSPVLAPIAPGLVEYVPVAAHTWLAHDQYWSLPEALVLAFDGEREVSMRPGEHWQVRAVQAAVPVVDVYQALAAFVHTETSHA